MMIDSPQAQTNKEEQVNKRVFSSTLTPSHLLCSSPPKTSTIIVTTTTTTAMSMSMEHHDVNNNNNNNNNKKSIAIILCMPLPPLLFTRAGVFAVPIMKTPSLVVLVSVPPTRHDGSLSTTMLGVFMWIRRRKLMVQRPSF